MNGIKPDKKVEQVRTAGKYDEYAQRARDIRMKDGEKMERVNLDKYGKRVGESSVKMTSANIDDRNVAFPTLFPDKERPGRWKDYSPDVRDEKGKSIGRSDIFGAYQHARSEGEVFEFGQDKEEAEKFAKGSWKDK